MSEHHHDDQIVRLEGVSSLASSYKGVLLDQFGVLHDGRQPYPGAVAAVEALAAAGLKLLILSNSSRRSSGTLSKLHGMGFDPACFAGAITSGEVTHIKLSDREGDWWQQLGSRCLHFTWAGRGAISLEGLGLQVTTDPWEADFILAHGTEALGRAGDQSPQPASLEDFAALMRAVANRSSGSTTGNGGGGGGSTSEDGGPGGATKAVGVVPMVVANPDVVTVDGAELRVMPGTLARQYADMGGEVHLMGKPSGVIYEAALELLGLPPGQVVAVGDSLEHDIQGARQAGVDSVFVCGGIHADRTLGVGSDEVNLQGLQQLCEEHGATPNYAVAYFRP